MRCLWLSGEVPDAPDSGLLLYSRGLSEALARAGVDVVGLGLGLDRGHVADVSNVEWRRIFAPRRAASRSVLGRLPAMASGFAVAEYRSVLVDALRDHYDAVVIDHLQLGWAAPFVARLRSNAVVVHVAHNHETSVRADVARHARGPRALALRLDAWKVARLEAAVARAADLVVTLTTDDADAFGALVAPGRLLVLPPGHDGAVGARAGSARPRRAVVVGSFDWHVKEANLRALLAVADKRFAERNAELRIVGRLPESLDAERNRLRATTFTGRVDDVGPELVQARVGIVAEPRGGGFKLKALDYVFAGVPVAMLDGTAAGLPLVPDRSVLSFPTIERLVDGVLDVIDDEERLEAIAQAALDACQGSFDWIDRGVALRDAIAALR